MDPDQLQAQVELLQEQVHLLQERFDKHEHLGINSQSFPLKNLSEKDSIGNAFFKLESSTSDPNYSDYALALIGGKLKVYNGTNWVVVGTQT